MIIAIDGPSGVGKSTAARAVAAALGVPYLDTGAMYRALGWLVLSQGTDPGDPAAVLALLQATGVQLELQPLGARVLLGGRPVGEEIRRPEVSGATSRVAVHPPVRRYMVERQREFARRHGCVLEGRDTGTVVFPDTPHKFFLDARLEVRALRRATELAQTGGHPADRAEVEAELAARDRRDRERAAAPLRRDHTYLYIDTSHLTAERVADQIVAAVRSRADASSSHDELPPER